MNMPVPFTRVMMKHMVIPANSSTICLDNVITSAQLDLVVMGFVTDTAFAAVTRKTSLI